MNINYRENGVRAIAASVQKIGVVETPKFPDGNGLTTFVAHLERLSENSNRLSNKGSLIGYRPLIII